MRKSPTQSNNWPPYLAAGLFLCRLWQWRRWRNHTATHPRQSEAEAVPAEGLAAVEPAAGTQWRNNGWRQHGRRIRRPVQFLPAGDQ